MHHDTRTNYTAGEGGKPDVSQNDMSASSLSNYTQTHTEDIRKMFAKTPAGMQE